MRQLSILMAVLFLLIAVGNSFAAEPDAVLESISYEKDADNLEKIVFKLNGAHIPKVFKIKGERPRLVFDFIDTRYSDLINRIIDTKGNLIEGVRVGIHNDPPKTRVVIDLKPEGEFKFEQDFMVRENTLSITFYPNETPVEKVVDSSDQTGLASPAEVRPESAVPVLEPDPVTRPLQPSAPLSDTAPDTKIETGPETTAEITTATTPDNKVSAPAVTAQAPVLQEKNKELDQAGEAEPGPAAVPAQKMETAASVEPPAGDKQPDPLPGPSSASIVAPADPVLRDVSFETTADNSEMVLFKLNDFYPPIVFGIEKGNPRVVCDFLDTELDSGIRPAIETKGNYISRIRVARHGSPDKVRVVLDLVPNRNYDLQQVFFKEDNLFIIIINEFEEEAVPAAEISTEAQPKS